MHDSAHVSTLAIKMHPGRTMGGNAEVQRNQTAKGEPSPEPNVVLAAAAQARPSAPFDLNLDPPSCQR